MTQTNWIVAALTLTLVSSANDKPEPKLCLAPKEGPAFLSDLTAKQKEDIDVEWEATEKTGKYTVEGEYEEPAPEGEVFKEYEKNVELELVETWKCGKDQQSEFVNVRGEIEEEIEWEKRNEQGWEKREIEDKYLVKAMDQILLASREEESESEIVVNNVSKKVEEETEWTQDWSIKDFPHLKGQTITKTLVESPARKKRGATIAQPILANLPLGDRRLASQSYVREESEETMQFDGPSDYISLTRKQVTQVFEGEDEILALNIELDSTEKKEYAKNTKKKRFEFKKATQVTREKNQKIRLGETNHVGRFEIWNSLNNDPVQSLSWKESEYPSGKGKMSSFTFTSEGKGRLPAVFGIKSQKGEISRITEFNQFGAIERFYVMYFPSGKSSNETKLDLNFEDGKLSEYAIEDPNEEFGGVLDKKLYQKLQAKIDEVKTIEQIPEKMDLPPHSPKAVNYPNLLERP